MPRSSRRSAPSRARADPIRLRPVVELAGGARFVLLGEAPHGTAEFYRERAAITRGLIQECGFDAVEPPEEQAPAEEEPPETVPSAL